MTLDKRLPRIVRPFINQRVIVKTFDDISVTGVLVHIDRSLHGGALGNIILNNDGAYIIVRGDNFQLIALEPTAKGVKESNVYTRMCFVPSGFNKRGVNEGSSVFPSPPRKKEGYM